jgi:hypothetical protein
MKRYNTRTMAKEKLKLDPFHYHEALDRAYVVGAIVELHLANHPVVKKHKKIRKRVEKALELLAESYQLIGAIDAKKFDVLEDTNKQ